MEMLSRDGGSRPFLAKSTVKIPVGLKLEKSPTTFYALHIAGFVFLDINDVNMAL